MINSVPYLALVIALMCGYATAEDDAAPTPEQTEFFETKVRPLLAERCHKCHGEAKQQGSLRLDSRASILKGGDTGPAIVPGKTDVSELVRAIRYDPDGYQMPPDGKLPQAEIDILTRWVGQGAPWPNDETAAATAKEEFDLEKRAKRWSFQPLTKPAVPSVVRRPSSVDASGEGQPSQRTTDNGQQTNSDWCRNPIDRFLLKTLRDHNLSPAGPADRRTLLRRAAFDITGLPPSPQQVERFVGDESPDAYERLIDDLLASPHFGQRWGRHWLDLVRYAEGRGHEFDFDVANPWHYRDYIIRALNDDVPYDQLVVEHVAGDLLEASGGRQPTDNGESASGNVSGLTPTARHSLRLHPLTGANESIVATGFWFFGEWVHSPVDIRADEAERFANMIDVYSKTFLGLTVACARCHDHKFDPITQKDFYALQGYLQSSHYRQARFETMENNRRIAEESRKLHYDAQYAILPIYIRHLSRFAKQLDRYLLASLAVFRSQPTLRGEQAAQLTDETIGKLSAPTAQAKKLESATLAAWIRHLVTAATDRNDRFHLWGQVCNGSLTDISSVNNYISLQRNRIKAVDPQWIEEDLSFYENAVGVWGMEYGEFLFSGTCLPLTDDTSHPYADFDGSLIRQNRLFRKLMTKLESDAEPGAVGHRRHWDSAIHTATFEIVRDKLYLNVLGNCSVYVAVDSHILIKGPLHGNLFTNHTAPQGSEDDWRWIELDVSRYNGHRVHVELHPDFGTRFGFDEIWQSDVPPAPSRDLGIYTWFGQEGSFETFEQLARMWVDHFGSMGCLERQFIPPPDTSYTGTCLHDGQWAIEHPKLYGLDLPEITKELASVAQPFVQKNRKLMEQVKTVSAIAPAMAHGSEEWEPIFIRGNWKKPGELVPRQFLEVFDGGWVPRDPEHGDRLPLAMWMVNPGKTPILPRVIVNRIWQHYFGVGIVPTPDDFGHMGQEPSHPELLDWLASELVAHDWSMKHIHRLILTSAAYRMASDATDSQAEEADPTNRLLHRMNVKRLEGEAIRDAILAISGRLDDRMYGRSVPVHLTPFMEGRGRPPESGPVDGDGRRSLYVAVRRNFPDPFFQAFDMPNPHSTVGRRTVSNVPAQALAMMNNPFVAEESRRWGRMLLATHPGDDVAARVRLAYLASVSRQPTPAEVEAAESFIVQQAEELSADVTDPQVWGDLCHVLLNAKEFLFVR